MSSIIEYDLGEEKVVLLNEDYEPVGELAKTIAHTDETPLHLAFSLFLFDSRGRMLVQRRALSKVTWPGIWSNSCCGHPMPDESVEDAVYRRTRYELGIDLQAVECILPDFRYRARWNGLWENELCPVWVGFIEDEPKDFSREEVESVDWVSWAEFSAASAAEDEGEFSHFSPWSKMEARLLQENSRFQYLVSKWTGSAAFDFSDSKSKTESLDDAI